MVSGILRFDLKYAILTPPRMGAIMEIARTGQLHVDPFPVPLCILNTRFVHVLC